MAFLFDTQTALSIASILCGISLFYLVMSRTLKRRVDERVQKMLDAQGKAAPE